MQEQKLVRGLGLVSAIAVAAGSVIGSGVFLVAADINQRVPETLPALSVWLTAGVLSLIGGLIFSELGAAFPQAGGQYVYLRRAFGPLFGFLYGWTLILVIQAGSIAAVAVATGKFLSKMVSLDDFQIKLVAAFVCAGLTLLNSLEVKKAARVLDALTIFKVLAILGVASLVFAGGSAPAPSAPAGFTLSDYGVALIAAFWAYDGWNNLSFMAGEVSNPKRNLPLGTALGVGIVVAIYLAVNFVYTRVMAPAELAASSFVAADAVTRLVGASAVPAIVLLVVISSLGCVNGLVLCGARVIYAMANDGLLPRVLGKVNSRHSPSPALIAQLVWSIALIASGTYDQLFTYVVFAAFAFYGLTAVALIRLRLTEPELERPYRVPFYPWLPAGYLIFTIAFTANAIVEKPKEAAAGLAIILLGIPFYYFYGKGR